MLELFMLALLTGVSSNIGRPASASVAIFGIWLLVVVALIVVIARPENLVSFALKLLAIRGITGAIVALVAFKLGRYFRARGCVLSAPVGDE
jgi:hypothetical protein